MIVLIKKLFTIKSLKNKLIISYTLLITAAITIVGNISYKKASSALEDELKRNSAQIIVQVSSSIDRLVSDFNRMALVINSDEDVLDIIKKDKFEDDLENIRDYSRVQQSIQNASGFLPNIAGFTVFCENGRNYSMGYKSVKLGYDLKQDSWYKKLEKRNSCLIGVHIQSHLIDASAKEVISFAKLIKDRETFKTLGYVLIDCDTKTMENIFGNYGGFENSSMYLVGDENELIYASKYQVVGFDEVKNVLNHLKKSINVEFDVCKIGNEEILFSYYTSPDTGLKVLNAVPLRVVNRNIHAIGSFTLIVIVISLVMTVFISYLITLSITRPLRELSEKMKIIEKGNFDIKVEVESEDEVGQLGRNFERMIGKINEMISKVYTAELTKKEAEINALQAQINPHFLYNTLAVIDSMAAVKGENDISEMCRALSRLLRYNIERGETSTIGQEIEKIKIYLYIEKKRFGDRFDYNVLMDEQLSGCSIVKLLIQPVVENAIVHGLEGKRGKVDIAIVVRRAEKGKIEIEVKDTGAGISLARLAEIQKELNTSSEIYWKEANRGRYHIGLKNVNYRIRLNYGEGFGLRLTSVEGKGTTVILTVPEKKEGNGYGV